MTFSELTDKERAQDWQPIETAPKVPYEYLLGYDAQTALDHNSPAAGVCVICWCPGDDDDDVPAEWQVQPFAEGLDCIISDTQLTHWMPLPKPPGAMS